MLDPQHFDRAVVCPDNVCEFSGTHHARRITYRSATHRNTTHRTITHPKHQFAPDSQSLQVVPHPHSPAPNHPCATGGFGTDCAG
ncbi:hypothetical protein GCM10009813_11090 [Brevibacterium marinum]